MSEQISPLILREAHRILKSLLSGGLSTFTVTTQAALNWLEERQMIEALLSEEGQLFYEVTPRGRVALLGREAV